MNANRPRLLASEHLASVLAKLAGSGAIARAEQLDAVEAIIQPAARVLVVQATGWGKSVVYWAATSALRAIGAGPSLVISPLLLGPVVVDNLLANPDVAVNLESVLRRVMPLDWREQSVLWSQ